MTPMIVAVIVAVVLVVVVALLARRRERPDDIASFRRQIDALSPESRRQTSDRMNPPKGSTSGDDGDNGT